MKRDVKTAAAIGYARGVIEAIITRVEGGRDVDANDLPILRSAEQKLAGSLTHETPIQQQ